MHDGRSYKRFAGKRAIKNPSEGKEKEMTQKKIDIVIKDKSNDYHIHFFITRDEAVPTCIGIYQARGEVSVGVSITIYLFYR